MAYHCKGDSLFKLLTKNHNSVLCSVRDIHCEKMKKKSTFQGHIVTLIKGQGHCISYHFEGHFYGYHLTKCHVTILNDGRDIQILKSAKNAFFHNSS